MARRPQATTKTSTAPVSMLLDDQLCFALYSATHSIQRLYRPLLGDLGLTYPQYLVLLILWENDELSVTDIGDRMWLTSASLTPILKRMETTGLVTRQRSDADERRVTVSLTADGAKLRAKVEKVTAGVTCAAVEAIDGAESLRETLRQLRDELPETL